MKPEIRNTSKRVKKYLQDHPELRDNDARLITNILHEDLREMDYDPDTGSGIVILRLYAAGKLTNAESIRRSRQKLQEDDPTLRGKAWKPRHDQAEPDVKQQIRDHHHYRQTDMFDEQGNI